MSIVLENLTKRYGTRRSKACLLQIAEGELFVLLGASGSGKSHPADDRGPNDLR
jgi:ABC-type Fe3+/spermidine/putrescine transport system ATPase subunit